MTMKYIEWLGIWLENYIKPNAKSKTQENYIYLTERYLTKNIGQYEINKLNTLKLQMLVTKLLEKNIATSTINSVVTIISSSLKMAKKLGVAKDELNFEIKRPKVVSKSVECFSKSEQTKIENAVKSSTKQKLKGILFCLYTGVRIGELLALTWQDFDLNKNIVTINKTCHDGRKRETNTPKTQTSIRQFPLPKQIVPMIKEMKRKSSCQFFISQNGKPVGVRSYQRSFKLLLKKIGVKHKGFHALRHTFATRAVECGVDIKTLAEILGHKNAMMTLNRYTHSLTEHKQKMMNKLGSLFEN